MVYGIDKISSTTHVQLLQWLHGKQQQHKKNAAYYHYKSKCHMLRWSLFKQQQQQRRPFGTMQTRIPPLQLKRHTQSITIIRPYVNHITDT